MECTFCLPFLRFLKYMPAACWALLVGIFEWLVPKSWYAKDVSQDIVLITGAGSGLGRAIALEYAKLGSSLVLWDINETGLQETKQLVQLEHDKWQIKKKRDAANKGIEAKHEVGVAKFCSTYIVDVSDRVKVQQWAQQVHEDLNRGRNPDTQDERYVSVLVNNAGIYHGLLFQDLKDEQIERIFKINIMAHFWTVRAFLPKMIDHEKGHIVEIASMGGLAGMSKQVDYCATKFATVGFEESLSIELDYLGLGDKIHTTAVCPYFFSSNLFTGFNSSAAPLMTPDFVAEETVWGMRCNHSRVLLPKLLSYTLALVKAYLPRKAIIICTRAMGIDEGIKDIQGHAALIRN